ncbi:DUF5723 family protein [Marinoscillum sp.]|uniref:DUF5723 family protein n=1 Tax=Marinoscillum sp. TaxID=2024838 RepID=UPI003BA9681E
MRLKKHIAWFIVGLFFCFTISAQTGISFFNLGNTTFQNSFYNPSFIPEGKVFIGLPALSGVHVNINNKFDYSDVITKGESGGNQINLNTFLSSLQRNNYVSTSLDISLLHVAYSTDNGLNFSLFANERVEADVIYTRQLMEFGIDGNLSQLGEAVRIDKTAASASYFREIGVGFAGAIPRYKISVGARLKYLQGFANASTSKYTAELTTNNVDYRLDLDLRDAALRTSGFDILQGKSGDIGSHLINNPNKGFATDLGFSMELNRYVNVSASIVDLGFISWKEDITNYTIPDTVMRYSGLDLREPSNLEQNIEDSLINRFKDRVVKTQDTYTTMLNPKMYASMSYKTPIGGDVVGSLGTRYIKGRLNYLLGVGYRHQFGKVFTGSASVTRLPQQFMNIGAALAVKGGPAQLYLAVDHIWNFDLTKAKAFDFRVGMNFIFGKRNKDKSDSPFAAGTQKRATNSASSNSFLGSKVKVKGQEGIYTIIRKQDRRKKKDYTNPGSDIPSENENFNGEVKSAPIPTGDNKVTGGQSDPIPSSSKKVRGGKSDPIPSGNRKVKTKRSSPIPKDKKKRRKNN